MARMAEAGTENRDAVRALATRYLAFVHAAFDPAQARFRNFMTYAPRVGRAARLGGQPRPRRPGPRHGHRAGRPGRAAELANELFHAALPAIDRLHQPARVGHDAARHRRIPPRLRGRSAGRGRAQPPRGSAARRLRADPVGRVALVRGRTDLRQRAAAACAHRLRREDGPGRPRHGRRARADVARRASSRRRTAASPRSAPTGSRPAAVTRRGSISSRSKRRRPWPRASKPSA